MTETNDIWMAFNRFLLTFILLQRHCCSEQKWKDLLSISTIDGKTLNRQVFSSTIMCPTLTSHHEPRILHIVGIFMQKKFSIAAVQQLTYVV